RTLGAVLGTALLAILHAGSVQRTAHGVVTHTRQVLHTTAADQYNAVLLQVVTFTADVGGDFVTVGQAHTADLTQCRVRFLRRGGVHAGAHATTLGAVLQRRNVALLDDALARLTHQLVDSCHL